MSSTIVLITGANTGLGLETVKSLLRSSRPYIILLGGRDFNKATAAAEDVRKEYPDSPSEVHPVQIDIEDDASIEKLKQRVENDWGRIDVLVNNAGEWVADMLPSRKQAQFCRGKANANHPRMTVS
jgi:NAD(P)-dependent dehydrogenase (short-subunit alcohol dehydrogenase family)